MCNCKDCKIELTALNMSDDDKEYCQKCFAKLVDAIPVDDESEETKDIPDCGFDIILKSKRPQSVSIQELNRINNRGVGYV